MVGEKEKDPTQPEQSDADQSAQSAALTLLHIAEGWTPEEVAADIESEGLVFDEVIARERAYMKQLKARHLSGGVYDGASSGDAPSGA